ILVGMILLVPVCIALSQSNILRDEFDEDDSPKTKNTATKFQLQEEERKKALEYSKMMDEKRKRVAEEKRKRVAEEKRKRVAEEEPKREEEKLKIKEEERKREEEIKYTKEKKLEEFSIYKNQLKEKILIIEKKDNTIVINGIPVSSWLDLTFYQLAYLIKDNVKKYDDATLRAEYDKYNPNTYGGLRLLRESGVLIIEIGNKEYPDCILLNRNIQLVGYENTPLKEILKTIKESEKSSKAMLEEQERQEQEQEVLHRQRTQNGYYNEYDM
ncbi:TPA: hypothetical protein ACKFIW_003697, partial [Acinetobacter baumannii]